MDLRAVCLVRAMMKLKNTNEKRNGEKSVEEKISCVATDGEYHRVPRKL